MNNIVAAKKEGTSMKDARVKYRKIMNPLRLRDSNYISSALFRGQAPEEWESIDIEDFLIRYKLLMQMMDLEEPRIELP
ncbi:MAG: hypothetical protein Q9M91_08015 [Candidatus Dojkabacteria bacterium]|nr:hypothetical protein [Candidatus Dojkabacteria bacterium]MDQ7021729.1 hypothetical protein [Candidatus Dojkabacteria bacterium]